MEPDTEYVAFKPTQDNWNPSYTEGKSGMNLVEVSLTMFNNRASISCLGADYLGLQRDFMEGEDWTARHLFMRILEKKFVNKEDLIKLKFLEA